jgi:hypothetical protein
MNGVTIIRWVVGLLGAVSVLIVLGSAMRTVMLPGAVPTFIARAAFLPVRGVLRALAMRSSGRRREEMLALQGPMGLLSQLAAWVILVGVGFAAVVWAADVRPASADGVRQALWESASSLTTVGLVRPQQTAGEVIAFVEAGVGLELLALVITYLPTIYGAFSRREALVSRLSVRAGAPPTGAALLSRSWQLGRFDRLEEVWLSWEEWFIDVGETHTSFPVLSFFRSPRASTSWVTAAGAVLDAAALVDAGVGPAPNSRAELCLEAGIDALSAVVSFFGAPGRGADWPRLPQDTMAATLADLAEEGVPLRCDAEQVWNNFARWRAQYEQQLLILATLADAFPTPWLTRAHFLQHRPPLWRIGRAADGPRD